MYYMVVIEYHQHSHISFSKCDSASGINEKDTESSHKGNGLYNECGLNRANLFLGSLLHLIIKPLFNSNPCRVLIGDLWSLIIV